MTILVTGGAGFIGANLCKRLIQDGHDVISVDNYSTGLEKNHQSGVTYYKQDISTIKSFPTVDVVYHLAAIARIQPSFRRPVDYFLTNANGTLNIVDWCARHEVPIVYAGSSSKHNPNKDGVFINPYTFSKSIGENILKLYQLHYNLKASVATFYNVYGPYQLEEGGYTTLIGRWMYNIKNNIPCEIYGTGDQRRDFTHVTDIVEALVQILNKQAYGYSFELGRGENFSVNEIAAAFEIDPIYKDAVPGESMTTLCKSEVERKVLDWEPKLNVIDYIKDWKSQL